MLLLAIFLLLQLSAPNFSIYGIATVAAYPNLFQQSSRSSNCDESQSNLMQEDYQKCAREFDERHYKASQTAVSAKQHQVSNTR